MAEGGKRDQFFHNADPNFLIWQSCFPLLVTISGGIKGPDSIYGWIKYAQTFVTTAILLHGNHLRNLRRRKSSNAKATVTDRALFLFLVSHTL